MKLTELVKQINPHILLRKPNTKTVAQYVEAMQGGATFPPVIIGHWPKNEKYGDSGIVDGLHRTAAYMETQAMNVPTETKKFDSLEEALAFMYTRNMAHGLPVGEAQRNSRIQLLRKIDPKLNIEKMATMFNLSKSSIDRILKGEQGEGKSGPKGANASESHQSLEPLKPKAFFKSVERLNMTCLSVPASAEIIAYASPVGKNGVEVDTDKLALLKGIMLHCQNLINELEG